MTAFRIELADVAGILPAAHTDHSGRPRGSLPSLPDDLAVTEAREDLVTGQNGLGPHQGAPGLPYRPHASEASWVLRDVLAAWVPDLGGVPTRDPRAMAMWLLDHLEAVRRFEFAGQLVDEVTDAVHQARRAIDRPNDRRVFLGRCGARFPGGALPGCEAELYGLPWEPLARCSVCGAEHNVDHRQRVWRRRAREYLGTATDIARALRGMGKNITPAMVRKYAYDGKIDPAGTSERGYPVYRFRDVELVLETSEVVLRARRNTTRV